MPFKEIMLGSFYIDGIAQNIPQNPTADGDVPQYIFRQKINIGDSVAGKQICWIQPEGMDIMVADRVLLTNISWKQLDRWGYTFGTKVSIDGKEYTCRMLSVGDHDTASNEWLQCLKIAGKQDAIWHYKDMYFWGNNRPKKSPEMHFVQGYSSPTMVNSYADDYANPYIGLRPVLISSGVEEQVSLEPITLEGQLFCVGFTASSKRRVFQPYLIPSRYSKSQGKYVRDATVFGDAMDDTDLDMYTLLMNGAPVRTCDANPTQYLPHSILTFTDQFFGTEFLIPWTVANGNATTRKPILQDIPAEAVTQQPFFQVDEDTQFQMWGMDL